MNYFTIIQVTPSRVGGLQNEIQEQKSDLDTDEEIILSDVDSTDDDEQEEQEDDEQEEEDDEQDEEEIEDIKKSQFNI